MNPENIAEVEWLARSVTASELLEMGDANSIVEFVGDWVEENLTYETEEEWSELCFVFYEWWGCAGIPSHTPEWEAFWADKASS